MVTKKMLLKKLALLSAGALALAGCTNEEVGALFGASAGALIGTQIGSGHEGTYAAVAGLSLAGAYIGSELGEKADEKQRLEAQQRTQYALEHTPSGQPSQWSSPQSGAYGTVTPEPGYVTGGQYCRPYTQTITVDGQTRTVQGTACRQADGTWYIVDTGS